MTDIGIEVGQKMRSAVKAKLMELDCYVDDELPDYIMVMVANKRTKSQMNEDLRLFLTTKTSTFVDWLHIVLKKLKEVHVTNPNVFKSTVKRKAEDLPVDVKSIKKEKKEVKQKKSKKKESQKATSEQTKSLTDDLPLNINNKLSEARKIVLMQDSNLHNSDEFGFDIPSLSEINSSSENELRMIEKQIKNVKGRLGLIVQSDSDDDFINIKAEPNELFLNEHSLNKKRNVEKQNEISRKVSITETTPAEQEQESISVHASECTTVQTNIKQKEHARIVFDLESDKVSRKKSVLERLGKRSSDFDDDIDFRTGLKKSTISLSEIRKEEEEILGVKRNAIDGTKWNSLRGTEVTNKTPSSEKRSFDENRNRHESKNESDRKQKIHKRLGVMSKVAIPPQKKLEDAEESEDTVSKEVPSVVKVKPRVILPSTQQANKNLLLKAVAEAQRSIAQTPAVGTNSKPDALFTRNYQNKISERSVKRKLPDKEKTKLKNIITHIAREEGSWSNEDEDLEYVPKPIKKVVSPSKLTYVPSSKDALLCDEEVTDKQSFSQSFIVTLDGIENKKLDKDSSEKKTIRIRSRENHKRRTPSPIIFDKTDDKVKSSIKKSANVPDKLPIIHASPAIKNKERCKYWPSCRQGDKCEFLHPSSPCKLFPQCKYGDKCLYVHPTCKFESSCTRRDCPYSHASHAKLVPRAVSAPVQITKQTLQTCKFFPHCSNPHCTFYHPRPCKFGKFCKNQSECNFSHTFVPKNNNFTWRNDYKL